MVDYPGCYYKARRGQQYHHYHIDRDGLPQKTRLAIICVCQMERSHFGPRRLYVDLNRDREQKQGELWLSPFRFHVLAKQSELSRPLRTAICTNFELNSSKINKLTFTTWPPPDVRGGDLRLTDIKTPNFSALQLFWNISISKAFYDKPSEL